MVNYGDRDLMMKKALLTKQKRERIVENNYLYPCSKCGQEKPADQFVIQYMNNDLVGRYRYLYECRTCKRTRTYAGRAPKRSTIGGALEIIYKHLYQGAKKRKIAFDITKQDLANLWEKQAGKCYYSSYEMQYEYVGYRAGKQNERAKYQLSCDRLDNEMGYTPENIVLCCTFINKMKGTLSVSEFYIVCEDILKQKKS